MGFLLDHGIYSNCVICHIRKAIQGSISLQNTQPFARESHGIQHLFAHNGNLKKFKENCVFERYEPIGDTDSEFAFCSLMDNVYSLWNGLTPTLEQRVALLSRLFSEWSRLGPANIIYSDGEYLFAFANRRTQLDGNIKPPGLYYLQCDGDTYKRVDKSPQLNKMLAQRRTPASRAFHYQKSLGGRLKKMNLLFVKTGGL